MQALRNNETYLWLLLILAAAAVLRFAGLDFQSYWYDELFSAHISDPVHPFATVAGLTLGDVHPPFYQLTMWWSYKLFGYTEWAGRVPSALAGVTAVAAIFFLGREFFDRRAGLYAAALAIANYYLLYYSQEARSYAFLYTLGILSFLFFARSLRSKSVIDLAAYVGFTILLLYTHYFGFILVFAQAVSALIYLRSTGWQKDVIKRGAIAAVIIVVSVLPLVPYITGHAAIDNFWITQPGPGFVVSYFTAYFSSAWLALLMLLLVLAALSGPFRSGRTSWQTFGLAVLLIWVVAGYAIPWLRGFFSQPVITDRNTIMLVPPLLILAGRGLSLVPNTWLQRSLLGFALAYSGYLLVFNLDYYNHIKKNQFRETSRAMVNFQPVLPVYTLKFNDTKYNVYFKQQQSQLVAADASELEALLEDNNAPALFWLADGHTRTLQTDIDERFNLQEVGRIKNKGTVAVLLVNPERAEKLTSMAGKTDDEQAVFTTDELPASAFSLQLVVAAHREERAEFSGEIEIALLASDGHLISSYANAPASVPIVLPLGMIAAGTRLQFSLPPGSSAPEVWLIP